MLNKYYYTSGLDGNKLSFGYCWHTSTTLRKGGVGSGAEVLSV